jgi:hypothetical protein
VSKHYERKRFDGIAEVVEIGDGLHYVTGLAEYVSNELAEVILIGVMKQAGFPCFIRSHTSEPLNDQWVIHKIEVEIT